MGLVTLLYLLGYYIMFKAKDNKVLLTGVLTVLSAIVVGIVTIIIGRNLESEENEEKESSSEVVIVEIPPNFEGGLLRTSDGKVVYVSWSSEKKTV
jgi:hypothetical protein